MHHHHGWRRWCGRCHALHGTSDACPHGAGHHGAHHRSARILAEMVKRHVANDELAERQHARLHEQLLRLREDLAYVEGAHDAGMAIALAEVDRPTQEALLGARPDFDRRVIDYRTPFGDLSHEIAWPRPSADAPEVPARVQALLDRAEMPRRVFMIGDARKDRGGVAPTEHFPDHPHAPPPTGQRWERFSAPFVAGDASIFHFDKYSGWDLHAYPHADAEGHLNASSIFYCSAGWKSLGVAVIQTSVGVWYRMIDDGHVRMSVELEAVDTPFELHMAGSGATREWAVMNACFGMTVHGHNFDPESQSQWLAEEVSAIGRLGAQDVHLPQRQYHPPGTRFRVELVEKTRYQNGQQVFVSIDLSTAQCGLLRYAAYSGLVGASWKVHEIALTTEPGGVPRDQQP